MNELMELTVESIGEEGLLQLRLKDFHAKIGLDLDTLVTLAHKAQNLQVLTIRDMNRTSE